MRLRRWRSIGVLVALLGLEGSSSWQGAWAHAPEAVESGEVAPEVDGLAATNGQDRVAVLVWHHCDDQYQTGLAAVTVEVRHLPFAGRPYRLRHYRIDRDHSNSYSAWVAAGRPQNPSPGQLAFIRQRQGLMLCAPEEAGESAPETLRLTFTLPLPGVSLLEIVAE